MQYNTMAIHFKPSNDQFLRDLTSMQHYEMKQPTGTNFTIIQHNIIKIKRKILKTLNNNRILTTKNNNKAPPNSHKTSKQGRGELTPFCHF